MVVHKLGVEGLALIEPDMHVDSRGYFFESFSRDEFEIAFSEAGIPYGDKSFEFVQENESKSRRGVVRGLHFQKPPFAQAKLISVPKGMIYDFAVDIRKGSPTYGKYEGVYLSEDNHLQFYIPEGFAHGFIALKDDTVLRYKCNRYYDKDSEGGIMYNDPEIGISLPFEGELTVSEKDRMWPKLNGLKTKFVYLPQRLYTNGTVLVLGGDGQLGQAIRQASEHSLDYEWIFAGKNEVDITDKESLRDYVSKVKPSYVVNCAAYTDVQKGETETEKCLSVNYDGAINVAELQKEFGFELIHISTDNYYDARCDNGETRVSPFSEEEDWLCEMKPKNSISNYTLSKYKADRDICEMEMAMVIRTSWLYGIGGNNFVEKVLKTDSATGIKVVCDQIGSPTNAHNLADFIVHCVTNDKILAGQAVNFSDEGCCSRYDFACEIVRFGAKYGLCAGKDVIPVTTLESLGRYRSNIRPYYSVMDLSKLRKQYPEFGRRWWKESLESYIRQKAGHGKIECM